MNFSSNNQKPPPASLPDIDIPFSSQISLDNQNYLSKSINEKIYIPKIDSNIIFQSSNLSTTNSNLKSSLSFGRMPSSELRLNKFSSDDSFIKNTGSIEEFNARQKISKEHIFPPEININTYFEDLYRKEIEASKSASKAECIAILEPYSIEHYAMTHFRKQLGCLIFNKQNLKKLTTFSDKPFHNPLLEKIPLSKKSIVDKLTSYILIYIGVKRDICQEMYYKNRKEEQKKQLFLAIIYILHTDESLVSECFMQLIKIMRDIPTQDALINSWKLFSTIASLFYVNDWEVQNVIRWFIVNRMFYDDILGKYAKYSLICFHDRTLLRRSLDSRTTRQEIIDIPLGVDSGKKVFKCSLFSQMWDQRRKYPKLPIPLALYLVVKALIKNGVMITPNPFPYIKSPSIMPRSKNAINKPNEEKKEDNAVEENINDNAKINNKEEIKTDNNKKDDNTEKNNNKTNQKNSQNKSSCCHNKTTEKLEKESNNKEDEYEYEEEEEEEEAEEEEEDKKETNDIKKQDKENNTDKKNGKISEPNEIISSTVDETCEEEEEEEEEEEYEYYTDESNSNTSRYRKSNMKLIYQWSEEIFDDDVFTDGEVCNLMGFLLMWMLNLIDPIIPKNMVNSFIETFAPVSSTINDYNDFIDDLPLLHKNTLKYIIGFFREIAKNENLTHESNQTIADALSSYFVCSSFTTIDPFTRIKLIDVAPRFILFCLDNLDVTDVYPLNPCYEIVNIC